MGYYVVCFSPRALCCPAPDRDLTKRNDFRPYDRQTTTSVAPQPPPQPKNTKKHASYRPFGEAFSSSTFNPFEGMKRNETREKLPALVLGVLCTSCHYHISTFYSSTRPVDEHHSDFLLPLSSGTTNTSPISSCLGIPIHPCRPTSKLVRCRGGTDAVCGKEEARAGC